MPKIARIYAPNLDTRRICDIVYCSDDLRLNAGVAHPVERHLAKVEVASSSLVARSKYRRFGASVNNE